MFESYDDIMTPASVAEALHVGLNTVYNLLAEGKLSGFKTGTRTWHIPKKALEQYVLKNIEE